MSKVDLRILRDQVEFNLADRPVWECPSALAGPCKRVLTSLMNRGPAKLGERYGAKNNSNFVHDLLQGKPKWQVVLRQMGTVAASFTNYAMVVKGAKVTIA